MLLLEHRLYLVASDHCARDPPSSNLRAGQMGYPREHYSGSVGIFQFLLGILADLGTGRCIQLPMGLGSLHSNVDRSRDTFHLCCQAQILWPGRSCTGSQGGAEIHVSVFEEAFRSSPTLPSLRSWTSTTSIRVEIHEALECSDVRNLNTVDALGRVRCILFGQIGY